MLCRDPAQHGNELCRRTIAVFRLHLRARLDQFADFQRKVRAQIARIGLAERLRLLAGEHEVECAAKGVYVALHYGLAAKLLRRYVRLLTDQSSGCLPDKL